ncbi:MAG: adenylyltransferase/cytidyltransferase family protein [Dehalococcoidia bacterium]|nr:adenylyltransferase/cytidyltransferase family protein [Dehalococcoidia bacterium]
MVIECGTVTERLKRLPRMVKIVAVSGYFDPPTPAHLSYFEEAKKLGDRLVVLLNNDEQLLLKRKGTKLEGKIRYPLVDRGVIIRGFRWVDEVVVCIDTNLSVAKTIKMVRPNIFAKGGDRTIDTLPKEEVEACAEVGCEIVTGVGCPKSHSSSWYDWE